MVFTGGLFLAGCALPADPPIEETLGPALAGTSQQLVANLDPPATPKPDEPKKPTTEELEAAEDAKMERRIRAMAHYAAGVAHRERGEGKEAARTSVPKGWEPSSIDLEKALQLLDRLGCDLNPDQPVHRLSSPHKRLVEIARALAGQARIIVMDEPTAALTEREAQSLFAVVARLKAQQIGVIYISHYLDEVFAISDRIAVLRDGFNAGDFAASSAARQAVLAAMLGTSIDKLYPPRGERAEEVALEVENLSLPGALDDVSFAIHRGEILGVFGLLGSGIDQPIF